jgi:ABC-type nitrate/sulfonate/bicarbonate transport system substrate-binding protein
MGSTRSTASRSSRPRKPPGPVRDKLVNGELDAAHVLYGLVYGVHLGIGGPKKDMAVLMT